jgi:hypothetical protein
VKAAPSETAEEFWRDRCHACAHPKHPLSGCGEIVGGTLEPDYCPCAEQMSAMEGEIRRLTAEIKASAFKEEE